MKHSRYVEGVLRDQYEALIQAEYFFSQGGMSGVSLLYDELKRAVCFELGGEGRILGLSPSGVESSIKEYGNLPYPTIALSYRVPSVFENYRNPGQGREFVTVNERVLLCSQLGEKQISLAYFTKPSGVWVPPDSMALLNTETLESKYGTFLSDEIVGRMGGRDALVHEFHRNYADEVGTLADFLAALACRNVEIHDQPIPKHTNRKRSKKGKSPLIVYKTLVIKGQKESENTSKTGTHASPRVHLRRGHIRRLPKGPIWVSATVVGNPSNGAVVKDYKLGGLYESAQSR